MGTGVLIPEVHLRSRTLHQVYVLRVGFPIARRQRPPLRNLLVWRYGRPRLNSFFGNASGLANVFARSSPNMEVDGEQTAAAGRCDGRVYAAIGGDGAWETVEINGREYVLIITPHGT